MDGKQYTLTEHLGELRERLIKSALAVIITMTGCLAFAPALLDYSVAPLRDVLVAQNRVVTVLVHPGLVKGATVAARLEDMRKVELVSHVGSLGEARPIAEGRADKKRPVDLLLVSSAALGPDGLLAVDVLDGIEPAPYVAYMVPTATGTMVQELMLEGANVILDPPRTAVLARVVRRAAGAAGKSQSKDSLVVLSPLEPFFAYIKIALVLGLFLATPVWLFQGWRFIAPGLFATEKRFLLPAVVSGTFLFVSGGAFAYFVMFPMMFDVLVNQMMPSTLVGTFTVDKYLGLLLRITVAFGVIFETPLVITLLSAVGLVTPDRLRKWRKYAIVVAFVLGALLTPAEPISQVAMAMPLIIFYELGIVLAVIFGKKAEPPEDEEAS